MNPDEQKMLREALSLSRENNEILKKLYRSTMWGRVFRILYWLVLIGVTVGSLYLIQPYIDQLQGIYSQVSETQDQFSNFFGVGQE